MISPSYTYWNNIHPFNHSFIHSFVHCFTHSFITCHVLINAFIHPFIHLLDIFHVPIRLSSRFPIQPSIYPLGWGLMNISIRALITHTLSLNSQTRLAFTRTTLLASRHYYPFICLLVLTRAKVMEWFAPRLSLWLFGRRLASRRFWSMTSRIYKLTLQCARARQAPGCFAATSRCLTSPSACFANEEVDKDTTLWTPPMQVSGPRLEIFCGSSGGVSTVPEGPQLRRSIQPCYVRGDYHARFLRWLAWWAPYTVPNPNKPLREMSFAIRWTTPMGASLEHRTKL